MKELHPSAAKSFDDLANGLLAEVQPKEVPFAGPVFTPQSPIDRELGSGVDNLIVQDVDGRGIEKGRYFHVSGSGLFGLAESFYQGLRELAVKLAQRSELRDVLNVNSMEEILFDWIRSRYVKDHALPFSTFLVNEVKARISVCEIWIPIATLCVEESFRLGEVTFEPIGSKKIEGWVLDMCGEDEELRIQARSFTEQLRSIQGGVAAVVAITADASRAEDLALELVEEAISLLRLFSREIIHPHGWSLCSVQGLSQLGSGMTLHVQDGRLVQFKSFYPDGLNEWRLSAVKVRELFCKGLQEAGELLSAKPRSSFGETLLLALKHYSIAALKKDPAEKLLYIVSALKSLILGGKEEGQIAQNFRERFAFLRATNLEARLEVAKRANRVYAERSRFVHGAIKPADLELLQEFMMDAWIVMVNLLRNFKKFTDKSQLLEALEHQKMSGPPFAT